MTANTITLGELSACSEADFTQILADVFEHSPWVAQRAWAYRPFHTLADLHQCMVRVVRNASYPQQLALIQAHPELAGKHAEQGVLTRASTHEQRGAGLDQCTPEELQTLRRLNTHYQDKFGLPFIIAVKSLDRHQIMQAVRQRLNNTPDTEFRISLEQIAVIALFRLQALLDEPSQPASFGTAVTLQAQPLNALSFSPFGDVIQASDQAQHFTINDGNTERYHDLARLQPGPGGHMIVSLFHGQPRYLPFTITMMERHPQGSQAFIPVSGQPWLTVVAPAGNAPQACDLRLFYCQGNQGVNYAPGVWHHPLLALGTASDFIVLDRAGPGKNCDIIQLPQPAIIPASYTLPSQ